MRIVNAIRKDLKDPFGGAVTAGLIAAFLALLVIMLWLNDELARSGQGARAVVEEDECAVGTIQVERWQGQLYCIGEP